MSKKIETKTGADPSAVLAVVRETAEALNFTIEATGPTSVTAHDGKKKVKGSATATKARVAIEVEPGRVKLTSETTGAAFAAATPFFIARINSRYSKLAKRTKKALQQADLA